MTNLQSTRWTLVIRAGGAKTHDARRALNELCGMYRGTLLAYARRFLHDPAGAEDAVQAFLERFVKKDMAGTADPARGSFRAYLRASLRNFLLSLATLRGLHRDRPPCHGTLSPELVAAVPPLPP